MQDLDFSFSEVDKRRDGTLRISLLANQKNMIKKYWFLWTNLIFIHLVIFIYMPLKGNFMLNGQTDCDPDTNKCNEFAGNLFIVVFYFLYICYFWLSASQIRHGLPEVRRSNFIMNRYDDGISGDLLFAWTQIPFVMVFKVLIDWTLSKTSLDIWQWFKFTNLHYDLYMYRCGNFAYTKKKTGSPIDKIEKCLCGWLCVTIIVVLLIGPLYLFSDIGTTLNPVVDIDVSLKLIMQNNQGLKSELELFQTHNYLQMQSLNEKNVDEFELFQRNQKTFYLEPQQIQRITLSHYSDVNWEPVELLKQDFIKALKDPKDKNSMQIQYEVKFIREAPDNAKEAAITSSYEIEGSERDRLADQLQL